MRKTQPIEALFQQLIELSTAEQRQEFLYKVCGGDAELRERLEQLALSHEQAGSFLGDSDSLGETQDYGRQMTSGQTIGPYKLREMIGEGGMGSVYVAEQEKPVKRKVALKVIKPGMDTKEVVARFEAERQALAMMDHPCIAKVYDAGMTESGHPFFAMELINGVPITEFCDDKKIGIRERLELFVQVCKAVQHAHLKGIIHRDVKPSNVLVTLHDGRPVPVVIDFGVAKAINQSLSEQTIYTRLNQVIGTTLYMSPEQAELSRYGVDTRTDIYSLGVLLYELLTGTTPFDKDRLSRAAFDEVRRIIREEDPPKPSTRVSGLGETATIVSSYRATDPNKLQHSIRGDLDWIVMTALAKDRGRRYETANDFAADLRRYLGGKPIQARPTSAAYRLRRFAGRNRTKLAIGALVSILMLAASGLILQRFNSSRIERQRDVFEQQYTQLFMSEIQSLCLKGESTLALERLAAARQMSFSEETLSEFEAQIALLEGKYTEAINILKRLRSGGSSQSITSDWMLAFAYQRIGDEVAHIEHISKIMSRERKTHSDHLFCGFALNTFFPELALPELEIALEQDRTSLMTMLAYGESLTESGYNMLDPVSGVRQLEEGIKCLDAVARFLPDNEVVKLDLANGYYQCRMRCEEIPGREQRSTEYADLAAKAFESLSPTTGRSFGDRSAYYLDTGQPDRLMQDFEESKRLGICHRHQLISVGAALHSQRKLREIDQLVRFSESKGISLTALECYTSFDRADSEEVLDREIQRIAENTLASSKSGDLFLWTACRLINNQEGMRQSIQGYEEVANAMNKQSWWAHLDFMRDSSTSNEDRAITASATRFDLVYAHYYAAFVALSEGDRTKARGHFQSIIDTKQYSAHGYMWSKAFIERLDDQNMEWLPWLNVEEID